MKPFVISLSDSQVDLEIVGGKGASLAKLAQAGLPVPGGFHVTTTAYREFITANDLQPRILEALQMVDAMQSTTLEAASQAIGRMFAAAAIPEEIGKAVRAAYDSMGPSPARVAVRSSATAEDLPGASFAGQQETYLNIRGREAVIDAVRKCWASLWTARAIAYRMRQGIPPEGVALAVVVQELVPADAAGILFTANPITGRRGEVVINAAWGLGEAIVGGAVTPDTVTVEKQTGRVIQRQTASKQVMTVRTANGTEEQSVPASLQKKVVLSDRQAIELARHGTRIEELYATPMDIEWAWTAKGGFSILQARPITTLGEAPLEWVRPLPDGIYMRTSIVDLMPDPLSPLFATLGVPAMVAQMPFVGRQLTRSEPSLPDGYFTVINMYAYMNAHFSGRDWVWILFGMLPAYPRMLRTMVSLWREESHPEYQKAVAAWVDKDIHRMKVDELWQAALTIMDAVASYVDVLQFATMGVSAGSERLLTKIYEKMAPAGSPPAPTLLMGWDSLPVRAEKSLYDLAQFCRERETLGAYLLKMPATDLVRVLTADGTPAGVDPDDWREFCIRFKRHLDEFGHMIFDLDFAKPLPLDHPEPMLDVVKMYLRSEGVNPHERQKASEERRRRTGEMMLARLKGFRRWAFHKSLRWAQSLSEVREDALAEIGIGYPILRRLLYELGGRFARAGVIGAAEDIFWLEKDEVAHAVSALENGIAPETMGERIEQRKAFWKKAKAITPPPMIPFKKKYMGFDTTIWLAESEAGQGTNMLKGVPASPGRVTAPARLLHGPEDFSRMRPGDVLVAGTTTPAWTPLFAMASAVVTDIGGPLSHGSIVAREYGIPAVMGTGIATRRIRDGQTVTVDGSAGTVQLTET